MLQKDLTECGEAAGLHTATTFLLHYSRLNPLLIRELWDLRNSMKTSGFLYKSVQNGLKIKREAACQPNGDIFPLVESCCCCILQRTELCSGCSIMLRKYETGLRRDEQRGQMVGPAQTDRQTEASAQRMNHYFANCSSRSPSRILSCHCGFSWPGRNVAFKQTKGGGVFPANKTLNSHQIKCSESPMIMLLKLLEGTCVCLLFWGQLSL